MRYTLSAKLCRIESCLCLWFCNNVKRFNVVMCPSSKYRTGYVASSHLVIFLLVTCERRFCHNGVVTTIRIGIWDWEEIYKGEPTFRKCSYSGLSCYWEFNGRVFLKFKLIAKVSQTIRLWNKCKRFPSFEIQQYCRLSPKLFQFEEMFWTTFGIMNNQVPTECYQLLLSWLRHSLIKSSYWCLDLMPKHCCLEEIRLKRSEKFFEECKHCTHLMILTQII